MGPRTAAREHGRLSCQFSRGDSPEGLLPFVTRTPRSIRKSDDASIDGLRIVECLKKTKMPLKDIRTFLDWCQEGDTTLETRRDMFHDRRASDMGQIAELKKVLDVTDFQCMYDDVAAREGSEKAVTNKAPAEPARTVGRSRVAWPSDPHPQIARGPVDLVSRPGAAVKHHVAQCRELGGKLEQLQ